VPNGRERIVWRLYNEGWRRAGFDVVFELLDPGIIWTAIEDAPDAGTFRGHHGVGAWGAWPLAQSCRPALVPTQPRDVSALMDA
jgi:hypothetical protein